jgi:HK97 family phage major capsid protein
VKIQVIEREGQKLIEIEETAFDKALHARVVVQEDETDEGSNSLEDLRKDVLGGFKDLAKDIQTALTESVSERGRLGAGGSDNRDSNDERYDENTRAAFTAGRTRPMAEQQYKRMPKSWEGIRNYEDDVMIQRWLRAVAKNDFGTISEIERSPAFWGGERAQSVGTDSEGGFLAPAPLANFIAIQRDNFERIAPNSMVVTSESTTLSIPLESTVGAVGPIAEGAAITPADTVYGNLNLIKAKQGRLTLISSELMADQSAAFSIVTITANQAGRKLAGAWDAAAAVGDAGSPPATGTAAAASIHGAATDMAVSVTVQITRAEIVALLLTVPTAWRDGGQIVAMGNSVVTGVLSTIVDLNDRPIYNLGDAAAIPVSDVGNATGNIEGVPYLEVPFPTTTHDNLYFGNLRDGFAVLMDGGIRVDTSTEYSFNTDEIAVRILERRASGVMQAASFVYNEVLA